MRWKQRVFTKCPKKVCVCVLNSAVEVAGEAQTIIEGDPRASLNHPWVQVLKKWHIPMTAHQMTIWRQASIWWYRYTYDRYLYRKKIEDSPNISRSLCHYWSQLGNFWAQFLVTRADGGTCGSSSWCSGWRSTHEQVAAQAKKGEQYFFLLMCPCCDLPPSLRFLSMAKTFWQERSALDMIRCKACFQSVKDVLVFPQELCETVWVLDEAAASLAIFQIVVCHP